VAVSTTSAVSPLHQSFTAVQLLFAVVVGAVPSTLMPPTVLPALRLPATSRAGSLVTLWLAPSPFTTLLVGQYATPDRLSLQPKSTVTSSRYQPLVGLVVGSPVTTGAVRSILSPVTLAGVLVLPARSLIVAGSAERLLPSPVTTVAAGWLAGSMPDSASSPTQVTVTSPLYQPAPLASAGTPTRVGRTVSMLMPVTFVVLRLPATSTASPVTLWSAPSFPRIVSPAQPATPVCRPEPTSSHENVTATSVLFQPNPLAAGVAVPWIVGASVSTFTVVVVCSSA
jgi:hypothetical protein